MKLWGKYSAEPVYIELDLEVLHMTADAVYLSDGVNEDWVPKSLIKDGDELQYEDVGKTMTLEVIEWKAMDLEFI